MPTIVRYDTLACEIIHQPEIIHEPEIIAKGSDNEKKVFYLDDTLSIIVEKK